MMLRWVWQGVAAAGMALAAPVALAQDGGDTPGWQEAPGVIPVGKMDRLYGKPDARFSLIIWLDPECPYCKLLGAQPEHIVDSSAGRVNLAVRLYPLPFHGPNAILASSTALCVAEQAGATGYYRFLSAWMARTGSNGRGIGAGDGRDDPVAAMAVAAGARNLDKLAGCTASDQTAARLAAEMKSGDLAGIEGTPAIAVRDNRQGHTIMVSGAIGEDDMRNAIRLLAHADDDTGVPGGATR
jgi:protein-disulfide isomerase